MNYGENKEVRTVGIYRDPKRFTEDLSVSVKIESWLQDFFKLMGVQRYNIPSGSISMSFDVPVFSQTG